MAEGKDKRPANFSLPDPAALLRNFAIAMETGAEAARQHAARKDIDRDEQGKEQPHLLEQAIQTFSALAEYYARHPDKLIDSQQKLIGEHARLWQATWSRFLGAEAEPVATPDAADHRFRDPDWRQNQLFDFLKQAYLITGRWAHDLAENADDIDDHIRHQARFYIDQAVSALSPSNFVFTNPEVLRQTLTTSGENLVKGMEQLGEDLREAQSSFAIKQSDTSAFAVGRNMALTPGKVVYQNDLIQLIQYAPSTGKVHDRPLLIVPPWINKYYVLDLNPRKSFIRWAVSQGLTVFCISWVNPDERLAAKGFADYMREGILESLSAIEQATGQTSVNAIGYCIGGTLLASALGYMAAKGDERIKSATFFASQVDFEGGGDLRVFVDKDQLDRLERHMAAQGFLDGQSMANAFNMLRPDDLIWPFLIDRYMKGKAPGAFDLLCWNADSTRIPAATHAFYMRECYLYNHLSQGKMVLAGERIDLSKVIVPVYNLGTRDDHIAPLPSVFKIGKFLSGPTRMVATASGHIAGIVNPPEAEKYCYWTNDTGADTLEGWLDGAKRTEGSWWPDWYAWVAKLSGKRVKAREPGDGKLESIEEAPGSYVKVRYN